MYKSLLGRIEKELIRWGGGLQPPCTTDELTKLQHKAQRQLSRAVPDDYVKFLSTVNGMCWNGLEIFACAPTPKVGQSDYTIGGYVESNLRYRELGSPDKYLLFAADDICLYAYNLIDKQFQTTTRAGNTVLHSYESFNKLIVDALKAALGEA